MSDVQPDRRLAAIPLDLVTVATFVVVADVILLTPIPAPSAVRAVLGIPLLMFVPGYAIVSALFPRHHTQSADTHHSEETNSQHANPVPVKQFQSRGFDGIERIVLSVGVSIAVVSLVAILIDMTSFSIRPDPVIAVVTAVTAVGISVAAIRRWRLPPGERFLLSVGELQGRKHPLMSSWTNIGLNLLLIASILSVSVAVMYTLTAPPAGDTGFGLLTEDETGSLEADNYPTAFEVGESKPVVLTVTNKEHESVEYTVIVVLERTDQTGEPIARSELDRFSATVDHDETWMPRYDVNPTLRGEQLNLEFLLYREEPPGTPTLDEAYRSTNLRINVTDSRS